MDTRMETAQEMKKVPHMWKLQAELGINGVLVDFS